MKTRLFFVFRLLLVPCITLCSACDISPAAHPTGVISQEKWDAFAKRSHLVAPKSIKVLHYESFPGMDARIDVTIEMPPADLGPFLKASSLDSEITNTTLRTSLPAKFGSFVSKIPTKFREGQKHLPGDEWLNVLVDEDSPTTVLVHLTWFEV